jgi:hypothetical protein
VQRLVRCGLYQWLQSRKHFLKLGVLSTRYTTDNAVLAATKVMIDKQLGLVTLAKKCDEVTKESGINPIVLHLTVDSDGLAVTLELEPRFPLFDVNMILNIRKWK